MADRWLQFDPALEGLSLLSMTAEDGVSRLPRYVITAEVVDEAAFNFYALPGRKVTVRWSPDDNPKHDRVFEGIVADIEEIDDDTGPTVRLEVRPWLWLLTQNVQCRIYQDTSTLDIIEDLIRNHLTGKFTAGNFRYDVSRVRGTYAERNYCVQYNESDFDFLSRILEDEGIYYYFGPDGILYFSDDSLTAPAIDSFQGTAGQIPAPSFNPTGGPIRRWRRSQRYKTSNYEVCDVHAQAPDDVMIGSQTWVAKTPWGDTTFELPRLTKLAIRDAAAAFAKQFDAVTNSGNTDGQGFSPIGQQVLSFADQVARRRAEEAGCAALRIEGSGEYPFFYAGLSFIPTEHRPRGIIGSFFLLQVRHEITGSSVRSTDRSTSARTYSNQFVCIPRAVAFRPPRTTPKPKIFGTQTALVVGMSEDAKTCADVLGRILVEFYWTKPKTRESALLKIHDPEQCSAWVRWVQPWAGSTYGVQAIPRVGHEVVVGFQDGDPDQPIAIGSVSNAKNAPAFPPKEQPNVSGIKTQSIGRDGSAFNGLRFDDTPDKELTHLRGQREILIDAKENIAIAAATSLVELASRHVMMTGSQTNLVGLADHDPKDELSATIPDNWAPIQVPENVPSRTRVNATYGYDCELSYGFHLKGTGQRHDVAGVDMPYLLVFVTVVGSIAQATGRLAGFSSKISTLWKTMAQGLGKLEYNSGPASQVTAGNSMALYRGGRYEFVGAEEWPLFATAGQVIHVGWVLYSVSAVVIQEFLMMRTPNKAAEIAKTCAMIGRGLGFILLNCERILAGLTAAKRLSDSGLEVGKTVQQELAAGASCLKHALHGIRKLGHAVSKIAGDLNEGNSFHEAIGGHYLYAGKDIGIQAGNGLSLQSDSIMATGKEISLHSGGAGLMMGDIAAPLKLYSGLFSLKHSLFNGLELKVGDQASITIDPLGKIIIKGLKITLEAGSNSFTIDPVNIISDAVEIKNEAMMTITNAAPAQKSTAV